MRVVLHMDGASVRGNEVQGAGLAAALQRRGHQVIVSCRAGGAVEALLREEGIATTPVRPGGDADAWSALRFATWLRRWGADALLVTSWKRAFVAGWAGRRAGVRRVVLRVGGVHRIGQGLAGWKYRHSLGRQFHAVIVNSKVVGEHLLGAIPGLSSDRVLVIPNSVRLTPAPAAPLRAELAVPADARLLVGVGGLEPRKGFDLLLAALAAADDRAHLALAGEGAERARLAALASALGISDRVHLLGWRRDVAAVLAAADVFVMSSRGEGMAVAMLEAAVAGLPVISTSVGGAWELLEPREGRPPGGWVAPIDDVDALAGAIREVISALDSDPSAVAARVAEARWRLDHWFTLEHMTHRYEAALAKER